MLEAQQHPFNTYATLTYDDEHIAKLKTSTANTGSLPSLTPEHLQQWLKRLRKAIEPSRIRFYACGEYGDENHRPHFHAAIFNLPTCARGRTRRIGYSQRAIWRGCCPACELVGNTWGHGDVDLGILETASAQYVAGYVTKKLTASDDRRLDGRHPEYSRMSNRPGIGASALHDVASTLLTYNLDNLLTDVPVTLRHGDRELPLGRYMRGRLRELIGKDKRAPQASLDQAAEELLPVRQAAWDNKTSLKKQIIETHRGKVDRLKARHAIYTRKKAL